MYAGLQLRRDFPGQQMRVEVATEQQNLEDQHAGGPDDRPSAEPRQHGLAQHRLDLEQQKRTEKDC